MIWIIWKDRRPSLKRKEFHGFMLVQGLLPPDRLRKAVLDDFEPAQKSAQRSAHAITNPAGDAGSALSRQ
jgi:hypothetical protein